MDKFTKEQEKKLNDLIQVMDSSVGIEKIDYSREFVIISYKHNPGTDDEWIDHDFMEVNTAMESVFAACYEVVNAVFRRCM